jgi:hypothetical protein
MNPLDGYDGRSFALPAETEGMYSPVRCAYCRHVYDLGMVEVTARYSDCSMWKCPGCGAVVDDRGETGWKSKQDYYKLDRRPS